MTPGDDPVASDAEMHLVAAVLLEPDAVLKVGKLASEDFYNPRWRAIYEAVGKLYDRGEAVDPMTLAAEVNKAGLLEAIGGIAAITSLINVAATADNVGYYSAIVRDQSFARRLKVAAGSVVDRLTTGSDWRAELVGLRSALEEMEEDAHVDAPTLRAVACAELESIRANVGEVVGLASGLGIERVCPTGIPLDKVTTIFGETGNFKTTVVSNLGWNIAAAGSTVVSVSWEDSNQLGAQRLLARQSGLAYGAIAARQIVEADRLGLRLHDPEIADRIVMADQVEPNIDAVIRLARYYKRTRNARAVIIDYLQLMDGSGSQKQVLDDVIQKAQRAAKQDQMAYILVSQVKADVTNRKAEDGGPRPTLDDCLGSSAMRIGTKLGLGVFRPWKYCRVPTAKGPYGHYFTMGLQWPEGAAEFLQNIYPRILEVSVSKNVMGEAPVVIPCLVELATGKIEPFNAA